MGSHRQIDFELSAFKWVREFVNGYNPKIIIAHIFGLQRLIYLKVWPGKYLLFKSLILGNIANALIFIGFKKGCVFNQSRLGLADWKWPIKSNSAPWPSARTITCFRANFFIALSHHIDTELKHPASRKSLRECLKIGLFRGSAQQVPKPQVLGITRYFGFSHTWLGIG